MIRKTKSLWSREQPSRLPTSSGGNFPPFQQQLNDEDYKMRKPEAQEDKGIQAGGREMVQGLWLEQLAPSACA